VYTYLDAFQTRIAERNARRAAARAATPLPIPAGNP